MPNLGDQILVLPPASMQAAQVMLLRYYREGSPGSIGGVLSILQEIIEKNLSESDLKEWRKRLREAIDAGGPQ